MEKESIFELECRGGLGPKGKKNVVDGLNLIHGLVEAGPTKTYEVFDPISSYAEVEVQPENFVGVSRV